MTVSSNTYPSIFVPQSKPYGLTYGEWTVKWWEWALSSPISINPLLDDTGEHADINQNGPVWFLAGTIGCENKVAHRTCSIPSGKAVLFPVINYVYTCDVLESKFVTNSELVEHVVKDIDDIIVRDAILDGKAVPVYRVHSEPPTFPLVIKDENKLNIPIGINNASADGYWVFLQPLAEGEHQISFHGACSGGIRNSAASYHLKVLQEHI